MATTLFLRDTQWTGITGTPYTMYMDRSGTNYVTAVVNSVSLGTEIQWTKTAGGTAMQWLSPPVQHSVTISGTMTFNIWAKEANMNANCGARSRIFKVTGDTTWTEMTGGPFDDGAEFTTASAAYNWTGTATAGNSLAKGDRVGVRFYITNVGGNMGAYAITMDYAENVATNDGDSWVSFTEDLDFSYDPANLLLLGVG